MRCLAIQSTKIPTQKKQNFKGVPERIGSMEIRGWADAVRCWEKLRYAKYLDIHSDGSNHFYRGIREANYAFLNQLKTHIDKSEFIQRYCDFTGFPDVAEVTRRINATFERCINSIARDRNSSTYGTPYTVIDSGCDPTCSIGHGKALPGSDLDKGYIILEGRGSASEDIEIANRFKGELWDNLDQRMVSLNHPDTFPDVYTPALIKEKLDMYDPIATELECEKDLAAIKSNLGIGKFLLYGMLGPAGIPVAVADNAMKVAESRNRYRTKKASNETDPYKAGTFNIDFAKKLTSAADREDAKNFAFFIETVESNLREHPSGRYHSIFGTIEGSPFVQDSNVTQQGAWRRTGYIKPKIKNRNDLPYDFSRMSTDERYALICEIIKYSSDDHDSSKFPKYFKTDFDVGESYQPLLRALK